MCGIVGVYPRGAPSAINQSLLSAMTEALAHRGPDDSGFFQDENIALGFKRLSIVDLNGGAQPMFSADRSVVLVCNGEIFNYQELRGKLEAKGYRFRSDCDVEVLIYLYQEYGTGFLNQLNGQFAFALYDTVRNRIFLARDHVGIAPLFYTTTPGGCFMFASEIKALLKHPAVKRKVNLQGLDQMLSFPGLVSPVTMFEGIHSVRPGHYLLVDKDRLVEKEYWDLDYPVEVAPLTESACREQLTERLLQSVRYRLHADVPIGFYLSGGLDSSLIAAMIHALTPGQQRHSFSINFSQEEIDEKMYQRLVSAGVNSMHHERRFEESRLLEDLGKAVYHAESPLKETYNACSLALSENVRKHDLKVVLTGEGADELFAGYVGYKFDRHRSPALAGYAEPEQLLECELREQLWGDSNFIYDKDYLAFQASKAAIYSEGLNSVFDSFDSVRHGVVDTSKLNGRDDLQKRSYLDFKLRIADHLVADHGDRVAYAHSVEARYPFLDVDLINWAKNVPSHFKLNGMTEKYILKECARQYLPEKIINREKFSFVAPGSPVLLRTGGDRIAELLSYERIKQQGYFNPDTVERLKKMYARNGFNLNQTFETDLLMVVITFGLFLEAFDLPAYH